LVPSFFAPDAKWVLRNCCQSIATGPCKHWIKVENREHPARDGFWISDARADIAESLIFMRFIRSLADEDLAGLPTRLRRPQASCSSFVTLASTASHRNVRDDRDPPLMWVRRAD
jgi:hypothetical protein